MESQNKWVLNQLKSGERLSSLNAVITYGIQDLPKRISELRQRGVEIESETVYGVNRHGRKVRWCEYWLSDAHVCDQ